MKRREPTLSAVQWVGVGLIGASFVGLIVIGYAITPIKHIQRRHPEKASEYDFGREWKVIKSAGILSLIFFLLGWALYRRGKCFKRPTKSRHRV